MRKTKDLANEYPYLDLLSDNSPHVSKDYYEEAAILDKQISAPDVCNIAVVAKYGAGKSSAINTYLSRYRNKKSLCEKLRKDKKDLGRPEKNKYTRISLSTFNNNNYDETAIERSILQQLLYSRKKEKLPNSKIERTNKTSILKSVLFALLFACTIVSLILTGIEFTLFGRDAATAGATSIWGYEWEKFVLLGTSTVLIFGVIIWLLHYKKLKRIKYKDLEADMVQDDQNRSVQVTNLINKFVDEVLYFFECVDVDLVIFEDLDRLPTTEIFVKLRELNTIINNSAKRNNKVTFLYAVKDDLFKTEEERAKFFEFILPVVPVINPITAKSEMDKMVGELVKINDRMKLSNKFIKGISTYVPDMRILKNTFNDYIMLFHKIIEDKNASVYLRAENLFALCLYKNLFPYDYALLEKNEGLIPLVINLDKLRKKCITKIDEDIKECNKRIEEIAKNKINSFEELKGIFLVQLAKCKSSNATASVSPWAITTFEGLDYSRLQHPNGNQNYYGQRNGVILSGEKEVRTPRGERFIDIEKRIKAREAGEKEKISEKLTELNKEKQAILQWNLKNIVDAEGVELCFDENLSEDYRLLVKLSLNNDGGFLKFLSSKFIDVIDKDDVAKIEKAYKEFISAEMPESRIEAQINYLKFLIAQNYIDEHYIEYTSNYKAEKLSPNDIKVVQDIQRRVINFSTPIESIENVIDWLDNEDFKYVAILNKCILDNIDVLQAISNKDNDKKYKNLITLLSDTTNVQVLETLSEYCLVADDDRIDCLVKNIINKRKTLLSELLSNDKIENKRKDVILAAAIKYLNDFDDILGVVNIRDYVENSSTYLKAFAIVDDDDLVRKFLVQFRPMFKRLESYGRENTIQQYIISEKMYEINLNNLAYILNVEISDRESKYFSSNFTFILSAGDEALISYITADINNYVKNVLLNSNVTCKDEDKNKIIALLTNDTLSNENKVSLLHKVQLDLEDITQFSADLYETLFSTDNVEPSWLNIEYAYEVKGFNCVKEFIEKHDKFTGNFVELPGIKDETATKLINDILLQLDSKAVQAAIKTMPVKTKLLALSKEIPESNMLLFVSHRKIWYENSDLKNLINKPKLLLEYVRAYAKDLLDNFGNVMPANLSQELIALIVSDKKIDVELRKKVVAHYSNYIKISGFAQKYAEFILEGNSVSTSILWQFSTENIDTETKLQILTICNYGGVLPDNARLKEYIMSLGESYKAMYDRKLKETRVSNTKENKQLLDFLKDNNLIISYHKAPKQEQYIAKIANVV